MRRNNLTDAEPVCIFSPKALTARPPRWSRSEAVLRPSTSANEFSELHFLTRSHNLRLFPCGTVFMYRTPEYQWHRPVQDLIDEKDANQIGMKIQLAEFAIFQRIDLFSRRDEGQEEEALFEALVTVRVLKIRNIVRRLGNSH
jgi:hypothetical protein